MAFRMNLGLNGNVKLGIAVIQTVSHFVVKERTSGYAGEMPALTSSMQSSVSFQVKE